LNTEFTELLGSEVLPFMGLSYYFFRNFYNSIMAFKSFESPCLHSNSS
jgi:hypothetical protein